MECSNVGIEIWFFVLFSSIAVVLFVFATRPFQAWLRTRRVSGRLPMVPDVFFRDSGVWALRALGIIPAIMWIVSMLGVYCFFHGAG